MKAKGIQSALLVPWCLLLLVGCLQPRLQQSRENMNVNPGVEPADPTVELAVSPTKLLCPGPVRLTASASSGVTQVDFYRQKLETDPAPVFIGSDTSMPYDLLYPEQGFDDLDDGTYEFVARASDSEKREASSNRVQVSVLIGKTDTPCPVSEPR